MGWLIDQIVGAIKSIFGWMRDQALGFAQNLFQDLLSPIVGTPAPKSNSRYVVVGAPDNQPWASIYQDVYIAYVLPLTIMLLMVALAYVGLRAGSLSAYRQKRMLRRIGIVFMGSLVWFPLISIPLQLVNAIGLQLAPINSMASGFGGIAKAGLGGVFASLLVVFLSNVLLLIAALVYAIRWLGILVLSAMIPLLGVAWAMEVWPLNTLGNIAKRAAGVYPGLVIAGLPAAILFRIGWAVNFGSGVNAIFGLFLGLAMIPAACIASILTVYWSSSAIQRVALASASAGMATAPKAAKGAKVGTGKTIRGAQNVHRGYSQNAVSAVTKDGQAKFGGGGSRAYTAGSKVQTAKSHAGRYNNLRKSKTGRMRDKAKADLSRVSTGATGKPKQALRKTKNKVSRW